MISNINGRIKQSYYSIFLEYDMIYNGQCQNYHLKGTNSFSPVCSSFDVLEAYREVRELPSVDMETFSFGFRLLR